MSKEKHENYYEPLPESKRSSISRSITDYLPHYGEGTSLAPDELAALGLDPGEPLAYIGMCTEPSQSANTDCGIPKRSLPISFVNALGHFLLYSICNDDIPKAMQYYASALGAYVSLLHAAELQLLSREAA